MNPTYTKAAAAVVIALGMAANAYATLEEETNHPIANAQELEGANSHSIQAAIGTAEESETDDLDFYTFTATEGDVINITAQKSSNSAIKYLYLAVFDANGVVTRRNLGLAGSATIPEYVVESSGTYTIGVSSDLRVFTNGGGTLNLSGDTTKQVGAYTLGARGMTPTDKVKRISMRVKMGNSGLTPLNPRAQGKIPVTILGSAGFDVAEIKRSSLTFGSTGSESSLNKCLPGSRDVNGDGYQDIVCHFENSAAGFKSGDAEGVLRGTMNGNVKFEGRGDLKVLPSRRK